MLIASAGLAGDRREWAMKQDLAFLNFEESYYYDTIGRKCLCT